MDSREGNQTTENVVSRRWGGSQLSPALTTLGVGNKKKSKILGAVNWGPRLGLLSHLRRGEEGGKFIHRKPQAARAEKKVWSSLGDWIQEDPWSPRRLSCSKMTVIGVIQSTIPSLILTTTLEAGVVIPIFQMKKLRNQRACSGSHNL